MAFTLYRVIGGEDSFLSNMAKCLPRRGPEVDDPTIWAGISCYNTARQAERTARRYPSIGTRLAEVLISGDPRVVVRQSIRPGHYTVLACPDLLASFSARVIDLTRDGGSRV